MPKAGPMFAHLTQSGVAWADDTAPACGDIIWCTGFRPSLTHLAPPRLRGDGSRRGDLRLLGYGDWTGPTSATLLGVGRTAKQAVAEALTQP
ncbi:hypothetical protein [Streptosporangium saharense]|uniref:hypothetical protein n=1 Tax=Streptosporangium saharense TaxID=1706840 RepID=UPI00332F4E4F